jgi:HJR/Mrr/RecB family endonuclease
MLNLKSFLWLSAAGVTWLTQAQTANFLVNERKNIVFMPYKPEERVQVVQELEKIFDIYVNVDSKIEKYSKDYPEIDPRPRVKELLQKAPSMTDRDFQYNISSIFNSLRDFQ